MKQTINIVFCGEHFGISTDMRLFNDMTYIHGISYKKYFSPNENTFPGEIAPDQLYFFVTKVINEKTYLITIKIDNKIIHRGYCRKWQKYLVDLAEKVIDAKNKYVEFKNENPNKNIWLEKECAYLPYGLISMLQTSRTLCQTCLPERFPENELLPDAPVLKDELINYTFEFFQSKCKDSISNYKKDDEAKGLNEPQLIISSNQVLEYITSDGLHFKIIKQTEGVYYFMINIKNKNSHQPIAFILDGWELKCK